MRLLSKYLVDRIKNKVHRTRNRNYAHLDSKHAKWTKNLVFYNGIILYISRNTYGLL